VSGSVKEVEAFTFADKLFNITETRANLHPRDKKVYEIVVRYIMWFMRRANGFNRDTSLSILGYIPIISTFSGAIRIVKNTAYLLHDGIVFPVLTAHRYITAIKGKDLEEKKRIVRLANTLALATFRAVAVDVGNMIRGSIEMIPVSGNIACFAWDMVPVWYSKRSKEKG